MQAARKKKNQPERATVEEVAKLAGVCKMTAYRALRGDTCVRQRTAKRILEIAEQLNYKPNFFARSMRQRRSYTVGVILPSLELYFAKILAGIQAAAQANDFGIVLYNLREDSTRELDAIQALIHRMVDGIIYSPVSPQVPNPDVFYSLERGAMPYVVFDRYMAEVLTNYVLTDEQAGAAMAVRHLLELGHTRIAHLAGPLAYFSARERHLGYHATMREAGLTVRPEWVHELPDFQLRTQYDETRAWVRKILSARPRPTAIFAVTDNSAPGIYRAAHDLGLSIPEQLSVVGYSNIYEEHVLIPNLTTVDPDAEAIGREAFLLMQQLLEQEMTGSKKVILPMRLIVRESTAKPARD